MKKAKILVGVPGCGKSTLAETFKAQGYVQLERDQIRMELYGRWYGGNINEDRVTHVQVERAREALLQGKDIVVSDTNINPKTREDWIKFCASMGAEVHVLEVAPNLLLDDLIERNRNRADQSKVVPDAIVQRFYVDYRNQFPKQAVKADATGVDPRDNAFVFDIDGTVANMANLRKPFDWMKVGVDLPYQDVIDLANTLHYAGNTIIFVSGRDEVCYDQTAEWLDKYGVNYKHLFMRPAGSQVRDSAVKHDIYHRHIANEFNVVGVFDDRNQVVDTWRSMGLRCYQVQPGNF